MPFLNYLLCCVGVSWNKERNNIPFIYIYIYICIVIMHSLCELVSQNQNVICFSFPMNRIQFDISNTVLLVGSELHVCRSLGAETRFEFRVYGTSVFNLAIQRQKQKKTKKTPPLFPPTKTKGRRLRVGGMFACRSITHAIALSRCEQGAY